MMVGMHSSRFSSAVDLLQAALRTGTPKQIFASGALSLFAFLKHFTDSTEASYPVLSKDDYLQCKRLLFAAFHDMDKDDDGLVGYSDLLDYLVQQRALASELSREQVFAVDAVLRFHTSVGSSQKPSTSVADAVDDDATSCAAVVEIDPPTKLKALTSSRNGQQKLLGAVTRSGKEVTLLDENFRVLDRLHCCSGASAPITDVDSLVVDDLIVTSHSDRTLRVWSDRDARGLNRCKWHEAYSHQTDSILTAVCAHPRSDKVFTGASNGEVCMWRFSNGIVADYSRGQQDAFRNIILKAWEPGALHSDAVKQISCFKKVDRIASCSLDGSVAVVDVPRQLELQRFHYQRGILSLAVCEDYSLLCTGGFDKHPCVWDYTTAMRMPTRLVDTADPHLDAIHSVCLMDGATTLLASCDGFSKLKFWDLRMMRCIQSLLVDREGHENAGRSAAAVCWSGTGDSKRHQLATAVVQVSGQLVVVGRKLFTVSEKHEVMPKFMGSTAVIDTAFDMQTGSILALHEFDNSIVTWLNGERRGELQQVTQRGENILNIAALPQGRKVVLSTSFGRLLMVNTETGVVHSHVCAFEDKSPVKSFVVGSFEAKPFVAAVSDLGHFFCWGHSGMPPHIVLPLATTITCVSLGTTDGDIWLGSAAGTLHHVYLPESEVSPPLHAPEAPVAIVALNLVSKLGVLAVIRADSVLLLINASFEGEALHQIHLHGTPRCIASLCRGGLAATGARRPRRRDGFVATTDGLGKIAIYRCSALVVSPNDAVRQKSFTPIAQRTVFRKAVTSLKPLQHWDAFVATSEDLCGVILDCCGVELATLMLQHCAWPYERLPLTTNASHSDRVVARIHNFFDLLRQRVRIRQSHLTSPVGRRNTMRRHSRAMSFASHRDSSCNDTHRKSGEFESLDMSFPTIGSFVYVQSEDSGGSCRVGAPLTPLPPSVPKGPSVPNGVVAGVRSNPSTASPSNCATPSAGHHVYRRNDAHAQKQTVLLRATGPQRPTSASCPPSSARSFTSQSLPGEERIHRKAMTSALKAFTGQLAVSSARECSTRECLPLAVETIRQHKALAEKQLPPSTLWAPLPRPPSPLTSRIRRQSASPILLVERFDELHPMDKDEDGKPPSEENSSDSGDSILIPEEESSFETKPSADLRSSASSLLISSSKSMAPVHRPRGASTWALQGNNGAQQAATTTATAPVERRNRDVYEFEQALQYRSSMKSSKDEQLLFAERLHTSALVQSYLAVNGLVWTLNEFQEAHPALHDCGVQVASSSPQGDLLDTHLVLSEDVRKANLLFDDDTSWRQDNLLRTEVPLLTLDASTQAVGGSLGLLFEKLVLEEKDAPYVEGKPDFHFTNVFLLMAPLYCCPQTLLTMCMKLYKTLASQRGALTDNRCNYLSTRILRIMQSYLCLNSSDFTRNSLERLTAFCVSASMTSAKKSTDVAAAVSALQAAVEAVVRRGTASHIASLVATRPFTSTPPAPSFSATATISTILDLNDAELCRQLCLLSFSLFEKIHLREFFHNAWTDTSSFMKHIASNIAGLVEFSGNIQLWVSSLIISPKAVEARRTVYRKMIRLCRALYNAQNFEMVNAVLEGLQHPAVQRLKRTTEGLELQEREELEGLQKVMDPFDNTLQDISYHIASPSIPMVGPILGVFYRAEENGRTLLYHEESQCQTINWSKILQLAKPSFRWVSFQALPYPFVVLPNVQRFLWQMPGRLSADALMDLSLMREPQSQR